MRGVPCYKFDEISGIYAYFPFWEQKPASKLGPLVGVRRNINKQTYKFIYYCNIFGSNNKIYDIRVFNSRIVGAVKQKIYNKCTLHPDNCICSHRNMHVDVYYDYNVIEPDDAVSDFDVNPISERKFYVMSDTIYNNFIPVYANGATYIERTDK